MGTANWYYYNKNGEKVGPISAAALRSLAGRGLITRETVLVNHTGRTLAAGEVNGLTFPEAARPVVASDEPNPFTAAVPRSVPQNVPVPAVDDHKRPSRTVIFGGAAAVLLLSLLVCGTWWTSSSSVKFTPEEQAEIDGFREAFGNDVNATDEHGNTAFHRAAFEGSIPVAKYLFSKGVDVNAKDGSGATPLYRAAFANNLGVVKYLVSQGADVRIENMYGSTPLYIATRKNNTAVAKYLSGLTEPAPPVPASSTPSGSGKSSGGIEHLTPPDAEGAKGWTDKTGKRYVSAAIDGDFTNPTKTNVTLKSADGKTERITEAVENFGRSGDRAELRKLRLRDGDVKHLSQNLSADQ